MRPRLLCVSSSMVALAIVAIASVQNRDPSREGERSAARRAAITAARGQLEQAQQRLKAAEDRIRATAKANPEMATAEAELAAAQAELERLAKPILARLADDPAYGAVLRDEADAARALGTEHAKAVAADPASTRPSTVPANASPSDESTVARDVDALKVPVPTDGQIVAATDKADQRSKRRELEEAAIAGDPSATAARGRVNDATAKLKALRAQYDATLLNDPDYRAAREQLAAARAEVTRAAGANY